MILRTAFDLVFFPFLCGQRSSSQTCCITLSPPPLFFWVWFGLVFCTFDVIDWRTNWIEAIEESTDVAKKSRHAHHSPSRSRSRSPYSSHEGLSSKYRLESESSLQEERTHSMSPSSSPRRKRRKEKSVCSDVPS